MLKNTFAFIKKIFGGRQGRSVNKPQYEAIRKSGLATNGQGAQDPSAQDLKSHLRQLINLNNALDLAEIEQDESVRQA